MNATERRKVESAERHLAAAIKAIDDVRESVRREAHSVYDSAAYLEQDRLAKAGDSAANALLWLDGA